jgi:glutathione S-transferase
MIRIHHHPRSTYSRRVRIALIEKNIPHELVELDMAKKEHKQSPYLKLNPYARVPALQEDGFLLYESTAILNYLEATHPQPALVPADARGRALVDMHMKLCDLQFTRQSGTIIFPKRFLPKERWDMEVIAKSKSEIEKHLDVLEQNYLAGREYLVGDKFSLAEVCYAPFLQFLPLMDITPPPAVAAWSARMLARPSALQTVPDQ